jgi:hypothetical protein
MHGAGHPPERRQPAWIALLLDGKGLLDQLVSAGDFLGEVLV